MDQNPNTSNSSPMGSLFSSPDPETLGSNPDPSPPPPASPEIGEPPSSDAGSGKSEKSTEDPKQEVEGEGEVQEGEEEEEAECGFCLFMKAGGCKDAFVAWEKCVEDAEKDGGDIAEKCFEVTSKLKQCMDAHADYYEPILSAEKAMANEVEKEKGEAESRKEEEAKEEAESEERTVEIVVDESRS
ncbi:uncharacterized protein LOC109850833 [Asparagus officinalis]|uniref:uncharacterized protein LOC109850833 n=1 Tax=Asparagus officinalis TaxID=4686 RepID=UPI00098E85B6|nr:uncharacterized protein LOC109850833 [Asparagus officinalis]